MLKKDDILSAFNMADDINKISTNGKVIKYIVLFANGSVALASEEVDARLLEIKMKGAKAIEL